MAKDRVSPDCNSALFMTNILSQLTLFLPFSASSAPKKSGYIYLIINQKQQITCKKSPHS